MIAALLIKTSIFSTLALMIEAASYSRLFTEVDADELRLHLWIDGIDTINDGLDLGQGTTSKDN